MRLPRKFPLYCWIFTACVAGGLVLLDVWRGLTWMTVLNGFVVGFAICNIQMWRLLDQRREMIEQHAKEIRALMMTNATKIGQAMADRLNQLRTEADDERPTLQ